MQTSKASYYDIEAFHNNGKLVIQFMPEYLPQIQIKLSQSGFTASEVTSVECLKYTPSANRYLKLMMQRIELDYSHQAVDWFLAQDWRPIQ
jgi:hypothetical protein